MNFFFKSIYLLYKIDYKLSHELQRWNIKVIGFYRIIETGFAFKGIFGLNKTYVEHLIYQG